MRLSITFGALPKTSNQNLRGNWRSSFFARRKVLNEVVKLLAIEARHLGGIPSIPFDVARVKLTRHSSVQPDYDGLVSSHKSFLDALVRSGLLVDDGPKYVVEQSHTWEKAKRGQGFVTMEVELERSTETRKLAENS